MKQKPKLQATWLIISLLLIWASPSAFSEEFLSLDGGGGALLSFTSLPGLETGRQGGWNAFMGIEGSIAPKAQIRNLEAVQESPAGSAKTRLQTSPSLGFIGRLQLDLFGLQASVPQTDGNLYRAWNGTGLGLLAGLRFGDFPLPLLSLPTHLQLGMGAGLRITKYSGTGLVSAHPSMLGRLAMGVDIFGPVTFSLAMPFELAWKSGGRAVIVGLAASVGYR